MTNRKKRNFSPEFRLECAQLIIDQDYTVKEAAEAMNVGQSTIDNWARKLRVQRTGKTTQGTAITPDQQRIKVLEKQLERGAIPIDVPEMKEVATSIIESLRRDPDQFEAFLASIEEQLVETVPTVEAQPALA